MITPPKSLLSADYWFRRTQKQQNIWLNRELAKKIGHHIEYRSRLQRVGVSYVNTLLTPAHTLTPPHPPTQPHDALSLCEYCRAIRKSHDPTTNFSRKLAFADDRRVQPDYNATPFVLDISS